MSESLVEFAAVSKRYGRMLVLPSLNLQVAEGEFLTLLGPSGCGKTTALRLLAGFETPDCGVIRLDGVCINALPPARRPVNTVFQNYALFPHLSVADNVGFGLNMQRVPPRERDRRVREALELVQLPALGQQRPGRLSGGQQQRVALARALVNRPRVLLLDEPLSALDSRLRKAMQNELRSLQRRLGLTFIFVTHDQEEALSMSDRVAVMRGGLIQQTGSPRDLYEGPANRFVARFVGDGNLLDGIMLRRMAADCIEARLENRLCQLRTRLPLQPGERLHVVLRPEDLRLTPVVTEPAADQWPGVIEEQSYKGATLDTLIRLDSGALLRASAFFHANEPACAFAPGERVAASWTPDAATVLMDDGEPDLMPGAATASKPHGTE